MHAPDALGAALLDELPWASFLPTADCTVFVDKFTATVVAAADMDNFSPVGRLLEEWRTTAEVNADPKPARRLRRSIVTEGDHVPRPVG